jgi:hypothetical protein
MEDSTRQRGLPIWALHLRDLINERIDTCIRLGLVLRVARIDSSLAEEPLHLRLRFRGLATVVGVQYRSLCRVRMRDRGVDAPRTLDTIHDVRRTTHLDSLFGCGARMVVEIVVLDLRVFSERQENVEGDLVAVRIGLVLFDGKSADEQGESDGEVERVHGVLVEGCCPVSMSCRETVHFWSDIEGEIVTSQGCVWTDPPSCLQVERSTQRVASFLSDTKPAAVGLRVFILKGEEHRCTS